MIQKISLFGVIISASFMYMSPMEPTKSINDGKKPSESFIEFNGDKKPMLG